MAVEITEDFVWQVIPPRPRESHKGTFGTVLAVAGSASYRGAALLIAALMAEGETCVTGAGFISRGYEHICEDLRTLGCRIWQPGTEDLRIYERK